MNYRILDDRITAEVFIMGAIGVEELTAKDFTNTLHEAEAAGAKQFILRINSPGGEVFEAIGIFNALAERDVTVSVEGLAASSASFIAMAGKRVKMFDNSMMMIHNPWTFAAGDANYFEKIQENLDMIKGIIMKAYGRTGLSEKELTKMMDEETWLTAQEAMDKKFIDEIVQTNQQPQSKAVAVKQYYNSIFKETRKANKMLKIQSALNLPGASEEALVASIEAIKKAKNEVDEQMKAINADIEKQKQQLAAKEEELKAMKAKLEALEKEKKDAAEKQESEQAVAILNKAVEDGKILPAEIDVTSEEGKKKRQAFLDRIRMNPKVVDLMPVIGTKMTAGKSPSSGNSPVNVPREAQELVAEKSKLGIRMSFTDAVSEIMKKHGLK